MFPSITLPKAFVYFPSSSSPSGGRIAQRDGRRHANGLGQEPAAAQSHSGKRE